MPVVDVVEERAFTASRVDRQHCPDQINFPPFLPCSSDPVWPLRRPIPLWAPFARARVSAVRSFSPTAGNFAVRPAVRVRPRDRQSTVFRTRPRRSSSASARPAKLNGGTAGAAPLSARHTYVAAARSRYNGDGEEEEEGIGNDGGWMADALLSR